MLINKQKNKNIKKFVARRPKQSTDFKFLIDYEGPNYSSIKTQ